MSVAGVLRKYCTCIGCVRAEPEDLDRVFKLPSSTHLGGDRNELTLREIFDRLNKARRRHTHTHAHTHTAI